MPNNIELRSEEVQEILEATPNWMIRWGNILVLTLIIMLFFISWFVKYPDIIALCIEAIKEQSVLLDIKENKLKVLEERAKEKGLI